MITEFDQQRQTEDAATNVQAATPYALNPTPGTTYPSFWRDDEAWKEAAKSKSLVNPPSPKEINKQMWIGSFMTALMVGLTSKDPGAAIAGGLWGAIAIHDHGHALRKRAEHVPQLLKEGYSAPAVQRWYDTGQEDGLNRERDDMLARDKFNEQNKDDDRNFDYRRERDQVNDEYRADSMQQRDRFQSANLNFRRQTLDLRREQLYAMIKKGQIEQGLGDMSPALIARSIAGGVDPMNPGRPVTAARQKWASDWNKGNVNYKGVRAGLLRNLAQVDELAGVDISNGTGAVAGYLPAWVQDPGGQQVRSLIANLQSQEFLRGAQNMKGLGALSEAEGVKIAGAIAALDPQSAPEELLRQVAAIRQSIIDALDVADYEAASNQWDMGELAPIPDAPKEQAPEKTTPAQAGSHTSKSGIKYEVTRE